MVLCVMQSPVVAGLFVVLLLFIGSVVGQDCSTSTLNCYQTYTNVSCYGGSDGSFTIYVTGGVPPHYTAVTQVDPPGSWIEGSVRVITGFSVGGTLIFIKDSLGCQASSYQIVYQPEYPLEATIPVPPYGIYCYGGNDGTAIIGATGGNGGYQYNFNGWGWGGQTYYIGLGAATYGFQVRDSLGCLASSSVEIPGKNALYATVLSASPISCYGATDGAVSLGAAGGNSAGYEINFYGWGWGGQWNVGSLGPGSYGFQVRDADGCIVGNTVTVGNKNQVFAGVGTVTPQTCAGTASGFTQVGASGGTGTGYSVNFNSQGFSYTWDYYSLLPGTYPFTVRDSEGCGASSSVTIGAATAMTSDASSTPQTTCAGAPSGTVTITAAGGTGTLSYSLDGTNYQASSYFTALAAGTYHYRVRDGNLCIVEGDVTVASSASTLSSTVVATPISCPADGNTGQISITASGGLAPYSYSIDGGANYGTITQFTSLADGNYNVVVRDSNLCTYTTTTTVSKPPAFNVVANTHQQSCSGGNTAGISFVVTGGNGGYAFTLNGAPASAVNEGIGPGTYSWVVTDSKACTSSGSATIAPITVVQQPVITGTSPVPTNGGILTITGTDFTSPLALTVDGVATTILTSTLTSITCQIANGTGPNHRVNLVSGANPCFRYANTTWSYAKPVVNATSTLSTYGGPLNINGTNFGSGGAVIIASLNAVICAHCSYVSDSIACTGCPAGIRSVPLLVTVDGITSDPYNITYSGSCGDNVCELTKAETCTTCERDCGVCNVTAPAPVSQYNFANSSNTIVLKWNGYPIANGEYFFVLQMSQSLNGTFTTVYVGTLTQYVVRNLTMSTTYYFKLAAAHGLVSAYLANASSVLLGSFSSVSRLATSGYPGRPLLTLARYGRDYLTVAWSGSDGGCALVDWTVRCSNSTNTNGTWYSFTGLPSDTPRKQFVNLTMSTTYYFTVQSTNVVGKSNISQYSFSTDGPYCGDFVCDKNLGETCSNCFYDCGACNYADCQGSPSCSAHGKCVDGQCVCSAPWAGPDCSVNGTVPINVGGNNSTNITINPETLRVAFNLAMKTIQEIDSSNNVKKGYQLSDFNATVTRSVVYFNTTSNTKTNITTPNNTTSPGSNTTVPGSNSTLPGSNTTSPNTTLPGSNTTLPGYNTTSPNTTTTNSTTHNTTKPTLPPNTIAVNQTVYNISLPNMAHLQITLLLFTSAANYSFGGKLISVPANSVKYSIAVQNWKFDSIRNRLQIIMQTESSSENEEPCITTASSNDGSDNLQWFVLRIDGVSLYAQFVESAILDGRQGKVQFDLSPANNDIILSVPAFWESAEIDPTYSVLLDPNVEGCDAASKKGVPVKIIGGVVGAVGGAAVLIAAGMYIYKLKTENQWMKQVTSQNSKQAENSDGMSVELEPS